MRRILHISDIHFGPPHIERLDAAVLALIESRAPHLVVISGDLTQRAKPRQFRAARAWIDSIEAPTITVPGNHDVPMYRVWERVFAPYGAYRKHFSAELEPRYVDDELLAIGVNTAFSWTIDNGRFLPGQLRAVEEAFARDDSGRFRIVVAHHPLVPPPWLEHREVAHHAGRAARLFARVGVDLVLSGHKHQMYFGTSEDAYGSGAEPVVCLHSGTTMSSRGRGAERGRNSCNWIEVDGDGFSVSQLVWRPAAEEWAEERRILFPRRGRAGYSIGPGS